jgi:hypothetical protein
MLTAILDATHCEYDLIHFLLHICTDCAFVLSVSDHLLSWLECVLKSSLDSQEYVSLQSLDLNQIVTVLSINIHYCKI